MNVYNEKLEEIIGVLGATPDTEPEGNIYVARLEEIIAAVEAGGVVGPQGEPGIVAVGATFPPAPALNELYFHVGHGSLCQWDGARWLGPAQHISFPAWYPPPYAYTVTIGELYIPAAKIIESRHVFYQDGLYNPVNYWNVVLTRNINISTWNTSAYSTQITQTRSQSINQIVSAGTLDISLYKVNNPGIIYMSTSVTYRGIFQ